jgi:hypothetical protein
MRNEDFVKIVNEKAAAQYSCQSLSFAYVLCNIESV